MKENDEKLKDLMENGFQKLQGKLGVIKKESERIREESERIREESKRIREESERIREENRNINQRIDILENRLNSLLFASGPLFNPLQNNLNDNNDKYNEVINKLEEIELNEQFKNEEEEKCAICLEIFSIGNKISYLPCFHYFHSSCIKNWLKIKNKCPFCNNIINFT